MKFTCEKNALVSAISVASRTVAQKSTIPALEGIYIRAGVKLTLSGYNLETGITISVDANIEETGACIMPSRLPPISTTIPASPSSRPNTERKVSRSPRNQIDSITDHRGMV